MFKTSFFFTLLLFNYKLTQLKLFFYYIYKNCVYLSLI